MEYKALFHYKSNDIFSLPENLIHITIHVSKLPWKFQVMFSVFHFLFSPIHLLYQPKIDIKSSHHYFNSSYDYYETESSISKLCSESIFRNKRPVVLIPSSLLIFKPPLEQILERIQVETSTP